jgi:RNA polymerase sigma factor FliA
VSLTTEQEALFHQHRTTAIRWLESYTYGRIPDSDCADFISDGLVGLLDACGRYRPGGDATFKTYAYPRVIGHAVDGMRSRDWVPRSVRAMQRRITQAEAALEQATGQPAADTDTAKRLGLTPAELTEWRARTERGRLIDLDRPVPNHVDPHRPFVADTVHDHEPTPDTALVTSETNAMLADQVKRLPPRERHVIESYYHDGQTLRQIGEGMGVTESRVSQLHSKALLRMRPAMKRLAA